MKDVTDIFDHYRIAAREIWNTAFWPDPELRSWDSMDRYDEIRRLLFDAIVLEKTGKEWELAKIFREPMPLFQVEPGGDLVPIMIQNPRGPRQTGYWDHEVNRIGRNEATMQFLDYFDWYRLGTLDFKFYHVSIVKFDAHPELVGHEALLDWQNGKVKLVEEADGR